MSESGTVVRVVDLETTGESLREGGVVEVGWRDVRCGADGQWVVGDGGARLVAPGCAISAVTSAVHHIVDEDVAGAPSWEETAPGVLRGPFVALAAHRAAFERRWCLPRMSGGARWICTYKCALRVWPEAPTHSNQGLRYWHRPQGLVRAEGLPAHRAGPDAYVTAFHLRDMLHAAGLKALLRWSAEPALLVRVPSGALRGRAFASLAEALLAEVLSGAHGQNPDMLFSARAERARRDGGAEGPAPGAAEPEAAPQGALGL